MSLFNQPLFTNRIEAGKKLAERLESFKGKDVIVFGLPRGGVPVAKEVAQYLNAPLDVLPVKKIAPPRNPEYAIGAVSLEDTIILNQNAVQALGLTETEINNEIEIKQKRVNEISEKFRGSNKLPSLANKTVILVDDGIATGETFKAAVSTIKKQENIKEIIVATPVSSKQAVKEIGDMGVTVIALSTPTNLTAISIYYKNFEQVSDEEVLKIIQEKSK